MPPTRTLGWAALAAAAVALTAAATRAQPDKDDIPLSNLVRQVANDYKANDKKLDKDTRKKYQDNLGELARHFTARISRPGLYKSVQEFKGGDNPIEVIYKDLDRFLVVPSLSGTYIPETDDYVRDLGAAMDAELKKLATESIDPIIRVNAARMLAHVARAGAPAHAKTITELLTNPGTQPDVRHYALKAAENFLAAVSLVNVFKKLDLRKHTVPDHELTPLVKALEANITDTKLLLNLPKDADPKALPPDQAAVAQFVRRQAVRALGQVRFATITDRDGNAVFPAYTLARVAGGDPALTPPPSHTEAAEAVIGLGNMEFAGEYQLQVAAEAAATGIIRFTKAGPATDKQTPWKLYAARISAALANWKTITAPLAAARNKAAIVELATQADKDVLTNLIQSGGTAAARPNIPEFTRWRDERRAKNAAEKKTTLYFDKANTTVNWPE